MIACPYLVTALDQYGHCGIGYLWTLRCSHILRHRSAPFFERSFQWRRHPQLSDAHKSRRANRGEVNKVCNTRRVSVAHIPQQDTDERADLLLYVGARKLRDIRIRKNVRSDA